MLATRPRPSRRLPRRLKAPDSQAWRRQARVEPEAPTQPSTPPPSERDQLRALLPEYQIEKLLGEGANGKVYRARWTERETPVALKVLHRGAQKHERQRFLREVRAIGKLRHEHIVTILDAGTRRIPEAWGGGEELCYYAMEHIAGSDLGKVLDARAAELRYLVYCLSRVARALHFSHKRGIVHRDVKPSNILLDKQGKPCLIDFGSAKNPLVDARVTAFGIAVGTPAYMAPEQARATERKLCPASDVFALGAILYEMLTGTPPHERETLVATLASLLKEPALPPRSLAPDTPEVLEAICLRALEKPLHRRYTSASAFADDLESWLYERPLPKSSPLRLRRSTTRAAVRAFELKAPAAPPQPLPPPRGSSAWREAKLEADAAPEAVQEEAATPEPAPQPPPLPGRLRRAWLWLRARFRGRS